MAATSTCGINAEPRRFATRLPRPLWIGVATILLIALGVGWRIVAPMYRQRMAIREIESLGGTVHQEPGGPQWLRDRLGDERMASFDEMVHVDLNDKPATDTTLWLVGGSAELRLLWLDKTRVTGEGLRHLKDLSSLQELWLSETAVTDSGLALIARLQTLRQLSLSHTKISDAGLEHLAGLTNLQELYLADTRVTGAGLVHLHGLGELRELSLNNTPLNDAGLRHLHGLTRLRKLDLRSTQVTAMGLGRLKRWLPHVQVRE